MCRVSSWPRNYNISTLVKDSIARAKCFYILTSIFDFFRYSIAANLDYGRHPDYKLAYVTLRNGETFEYPPVVHEKGDGDIDTTLKEQETLEKFFEFEKQQNWKKKYGAPNWFS